MGDTNSVCAELVRELSRRGETLSVCESLTAGLCAARIADIPGASAVLLGGFITYATRLKEELAGVSHDIVEDFGVVSPQCVEAMAAGARTRCGSTWAVALSGVAGPDLQEGHPAGTVFIGIAGPVGTTSESATSASTTSLKAGGEAGLTGDRQSIREQAVAHACAALLSAVKAR